MSPALLRAEAVSVRRGDRTVLEPFDLALAPGERVAIYGPNGAGKSSMLQALAGLLPFASGEVSFEGHAIGRQLSLLEYHRRTAAMFQEPLLLHGTVRHNVELGLRLRGVPRAQRDTRVRPWLERLRIAHLADRPAASLSGGEAQRASLARALVLDPQVLFLDEPFAALDAPTRVQLAEDLSSILDERRIATLFVTHDIDEAAELCERCAVLDAGRVLQQGEMATVLERPASRRVAAIIGAFNVFEGRVAELCAEGARLDWGGHRILANREASVGADVAFLIQTEQLSLRSAGAEPFNQVRGRVVRVHRRRGSLIGSIDVGAPALLQVPFGPGERPTADREVVVSFPPGAVWIFPR